VRLRLLIASCVVLLVAALFGAAQMRTYITEDARFCGTCHQSSPEFALWGQNQHGGVACQKCHHTTTEQGLGMLSAFLKGKSPGANADHHAPVEIGACASCHLTHDKEWATQVGASRGHRIHAIDQKISCVRCHAAGVHRFEPAAKSCAECHPAHTVAAKAMHELHCLACHDFLSTEKLLRPSRRDCLRCHQARGIHPSRFPEDAPMRFACAACHKPHAATGHERVACDTCHSTVPTLGLHQKPSHRSCKDCHRAHAWRTEKEDCLKCHKSAASHFGDRPTCVECHSWKAAAAPPNPPRGN
jgi:hypothetical protein